MSESMSRSTKFANDNEVNAINNAGDVLPIFILSLSQSFEHYNHFGRQDKGTKVCQNHCHNLTMLSS